MAANIGEVRVGPWGGEDGTQWQYQIKDGERIIGFTIIYNSDTIFGLNLTVASPNPSVVPLFGDVGVERAGSVVTVDFKDDEHITGFSGTYAANQAGRTYVTSLSFITNKQTHGPYGTPRGTNFVLPVYKGKFVGYFGWFSAALSSLGAIIKPE